MLAATAAIRELAARFTIREVAYDPWRYHSEALRLADDGLPVVEFPQSHARMTVASERLHAAIVEQRLRHNGDPALTLHVSQAVAQATGRGWRLSKIARTRRSTRQSRSRWPSNAPNISPRPSA